MKHIKKRIILSSLVLLLIGITYIKNKPEEINILVEENKHENKNIMSVYIINEDGTTEKVDDIPNNYNVKRSECSGGATVTGITPNIEINNVTKTGVSCTLYLEELKPTTASTLIATADKTSITTSAGFGVVDTSEGGLYEFDGITEGSKTQLYRGAVTNNYVKLGTTGNETYWRIVRFDEEGNIRLIYDGTNAHDNGEVSNDKVLTTNYDGTSMITPIYYGSNNNAAYVGWTLTSNQQRPNNTAGDYPSGGTPSNMKNYLENTWLSTFKSRLSDTEKAQLTTGKYCNDRTLQSGSWNTGSTMYFGAYKRLSTNKTPSFACDTRDIYTLEIGLLTADEYSFAGGGGYNQTNTSFYLYTGKNWWTMSPCHWSGTNASVFYVYEGGYLNNNLVDYPFGVRPVITLNKNTFFDPNTNGTKDNPYTII